MDVRWYIRGLLAQPYLTSYAPYPVPNVDAEGLLERRVQQAVQNFSVAVNMAFYLMNSPPAERGLSGGS